MIVFFECGQLGNQLFQYCALKSLRNKGAHCFIGMTALESTFCGVENSKDIKGKIIKQVVRRLGKNRLDMLAKKMKLIGLIEEERTPSGSGFRIVDGFFKRIHYCDQAYFQTEKMIEDAIVAELEIKPAILERAAEIFSTFPSDRTATCFVHVRRGDYVRWPSRKAPAVLPLRWYREQMDTIRSRYDKPFFVVVSDDWPYVDEMFGQETDVYVSHAEESVDFALMSRCDGGVLSASSFSWWAAYFARRTKSDPFFIAPLHWGGHREGRWYPECIETSWLNYVQVD